MPLRCSCSCRAAEKWNLRVLFLVSTVLGVVSMGSSLLLVGLVMDSVNPGSLFENWGLPVPVSRGGAGRQVTGMVCRVGGAGIKPRGPAKPCNPPSCWAAGICHALRQASNTWRLKAAQGHSLHSS